MRNYIHIIRNLPGILQRLESELQSKASAFSVETLCADMNSLNRRLADRPTKADLTIVEGDLGARIEKLEVTTSREELRQNIRASIKRAKAEVAKATDLNAEKTGGPNLMDVLAKVKAEKASKPNISEVMKGLKTVDVTVDGKASDPKPKLPRKPRTPKGGGK